MDKVNLNMKMVITLKEITLKMKKEEKENITLVKVVSYNHNSIPTHHKYQKYTYQMDQSTQENKKTDQEKDPVVHPMSMVAIMMASG
jgi:hypothetical protein